jgi:hypothetical protein
VQRARERRERHENVEGLELWPLNMSRESHDRHKQTDNYKQISNDFINTNVERLKHLYSFARCSNMYEKMYRNAAKC